MKEYLKKAERRLIRTLKAVDKNRLLNCMEAVLKKYGARTDSIRGLTRLWSYSPDRIYTENGSIVCACADGPLGPAFFVPGIIRCARKENFELAVLHTYAHEMAHYLGKRSISKVAVTASDGSVGYEEQTVSGFQVALKISTITPGWQEGYSVGCRFHYFNEGVTELLGREIFTEYVKHKKISNTTRSEIEQYVYDLNTFRGTGFYRDAVTFVNAIVERFARTSHKSEREVRSWLYGAYVAGTNLSDCAAWHEFVQRADLQCDLTAKLKDAKIKDLAHLLDKEL